MKRKSTFRRSPKALPRHDGGSAGFPSEIGEAGDRRITSICRSQAPRAEERESEIAHGGYRNPSRGGGQGISPDWIERGLSVLARIAGRFEIRKEARSSGSRPFVFITC